MVFVCHFRLSHFLVHVNACTRHCNKSILYGIYIQVQPLGAAPGGGGGGGDEGDGGKDGKDGGADDVEFVRSKTRRKRKRVHHQKLSKVTMMGGDDETVPLVKAFYFFHIAPITKFYFHSVSIMQGCLDVMT